MLMALPRRDSIDRALETLFVEAERVNKFGFTSSELEREKESRAAGVVAADDGEGQAASPGSWPTSTSGTSRRRRPFPGLEYEADLTGRRVPGISLTEVNGAGQGVDAEGNRVVGDQRGRREPR
jgi:zinc protease